MKKILSSCVLVASLLAGCSDSDQAEEATNEPKEEEWQESYKDIAISEIERYLELTEENGELAADRLEEHAGVVKQQADKISDEELKEDLNKIADLITDNSVEEVKESLNNLE